MKTMTMTLACIVLLASSACDLESVEESPTREVDHEDDGLLEREAADERDTDEVAEEQDIRAALCHHLGSFTITKTNCTYAVDLIDQAQRHCRSLGGAIKTRQFGPPCASHAYRRLSYSCCAS